MARRRWSEEETAYLIANCAMMSACEMAKALRRAPSSVRDKLNELHFQSRDSEQLRKRTLCWDCKNANETCPWFRQNPKPVEGWTADKTVLRDTHGNYSTESYFVKKCPLFMPMVAAPKEIKPAKKPTNLFADSPCETTCRGEKKSRCLQNCGRCKQFDDWMLENHIWRRVTKPFKKQTQFDEERFLQMYRSGMSARAIAREFKVSRSTARYWVERQRRNETMERKTAG